MKKVFICAVAAMLACGSFVALNATSTETKVEMQSGYTLTVYQLRQGNGTLVIIKTCKGYYDEDNGTLTVEGETMTVYSNSRYGDGTTFGKYRYRAGNYYFN